MANRNSLIELLEDLTTGKDYEHSKKNVKIEDRRHIQDKKPKVFEYDHKFCVTKPEDFNQRTVVPKPSDYGNNYLTPKPNNDFFVPNKNYPSPSWPQNFDPSNLHRPSGHMTNNPNVVGFGHFNSPSSTGGHCHVQSPYNVFSTTAHFDQKLNCVPFPPNSENIISSPAPYGAGFTAGLQLPFDANAVKPPYSSDLQSGSVSGLKGICNKPIPAPNQYFQIPYHEYANKTNLNPFKNNSPGINYKEANITCKPNSYSNLNLIPPPSPPVLFKNFKTKNSFSENVKINSNTKTKTTSNSSNSFRGPRTPPLSCSKSSSSKRVYTSSKGPHTPPMKVKGPCTPPQKGPCTPPQKGPCTPPQKRPCTPPQKRPCTPPQKGPCTPPQKGPCTPPQKGPCTPPQKGPCTPPQKGPCTPPQKGLGTHPQKRPCTPPLKGPRTPPLKGPHTPPLKSPSVPSKGPQTPPTSPCASLLNRDFSGSQTHPPLPPNPNKPPLPTSLPISNELELKTLLEPPKSQSQKVIIIRRRSQELSSSDSDSSDKPDTFYPDYRRKSQDSPENSPFKNDIISTNSVCKDNLQGSDGTLREEPVLKESCGNYFYGSSFFKNEFSEDSCRDTGSKTEPPISRKVKHKIKDNPEKDSINSNGKISHLSKSYENKDCLKPISENLNSNIPEKSNLYSPKNHFSGLRCSDSSDDKDSSSDESSGNENSSESDSKSVHSPFIKYSDYEELLNLETKRLTMEQELSQGDIEPELKVVNEIDSLVGLPENGSPILYDLPEDSPPNISPPAPLKSLSPMPLCIKEPGKPKYPRYFKDKVAFSSSFQPPFNEVHLHSPEQDYDGKADNLDSLPLKELPRFGEIKIYNKSILPTNTAKVAKTPLIKRLGLVEERCLNDPQEPVVKLTPVLQNQTRGKNETLVSHNIQSSVSPSNNESNQNKIIETPKPVRKLVIVENQEGKLTKVKLASPTFPEKTVPAKMKPRENKELHHTSFRSKAILRTPKGRAHAQKSSENKNVKASPMRLDLDSRIKILFGTKNDSPQKSNIVDSPLKYHYKNYPPLARPPSPFRNRNLYLYWHRETYYFRKHNPNPPPGSVDPMLRRKIGIQITHKSSLSLESKIESSNKPELESVDKSNIALEQLDLVPPVKLIQSPKVCHLEKPNEVDEIIQEFQVTSDKSYETNSDYDQFADPVNIENNNIAISTLKNAQYSDTSLVPAEITRIDVPPNNELELVSELAEMDVNNISEPIKQALENSNKGPEDMVEMVLNRLIDAFKDSLKRKITDSVVNNEDIWDNLKPSKISKSE